MLVLLMFASRGLDDDVGDASIGTEHATHLLGIAVEAVVVVARYLYGAGAVLQIERVAEAAVAHAVGAPVGSSNGDDLAYDLVLQYIREASVECLIGELHRDVRSQAADSSFVSFDLVKLRKEGLDLRHLVIEFVDTASQRHLCAYVEFHLLFSRTEGVGIKAVDKQLKRTSEGTCEEEQKNPAPQPVLGEAEIAAIESRGHSRVPHAAHGAHTAAAVAKAAHESWSEKDGNEECHSEIDHDNDGEVPEVVAQMLGQPEDHNERAYGGEHGCQYAKEGLAVAIVTVMVDHDNGGVDDDAE